jgi:hypothetical protein
MAAATSVTSYVVALGPIKVELVFCTMASDGDYYDSKLVAPKFAFANTNTAADTVQPSSSISGKRVTLVCTDISSSLVQMIIVGH